jgi:hypothetical protein
MLFINIVILSIAAVIALFIDDTFVGFIDAFANGSMKWLLSPNSILVIDNPKMLFLAVVVLITGMILFTGTIIALTTNAIKDYFQKKQSGSGKIYLEHHVVILNWNNKVPELVADLLHVENSQMTVMILADIDKAYAEKQIMSATRDLILKKAAYKNFNVLVKSGDPLNENDLLDISILDAATILIMNKDMHEEIAEDMTKSDLNVIKVILSVGRLHFKHNPPIVAEIKNIATKAKILTLSSVVDTLHEHDIFPICFDRRLGQIIAQTIINPRMEDVYLSLFSFEGAEVYFIPKGDFEEVLLQYSHAIPLAKTEGGIFVLAENDQDIHRKDERIPEVINLKTKPLDEKTDMEVYIIGKNNKLDFILNAFSQYERIHHSTFVSRYVPQDQLESLLDTVNTEKKPVTFVLLSDERQQADSLDANVIDTLIRIEGNLLHREANIIVELLDPRNDPIISDFNIRNTIISNKIISLLLSKLALYKETAPFYENLLTIAPNAAGEDDQAIIIRSVKDLFAMPMPIKFPSVKSFVVSTHMAFSSLLIPMGIISDHQLSLFSGNLFEHDLELNESDIIILMKL